MGHNIDRYIIVMPVIIGIYSLLKRYLGHTKLMSCFTDYLPSQDDLEKVHHENNLHH